MKVVLAALYRSHLFHMATELKKHHYLHKLITGYPKFKINKGWQELTSVSISTFLFGISWKLLIVLERLKIPFFILTRLRRLLYKEFSKKISTLVDKNDDYLIGPSGFMLEAIDGIKDKKIKTIVDHGSLHEVTNRDILLEECSKYGFSPFGNWQHSWMIERMDLEFKNADYVCVCSKLAKKTLVDNGIEEDKVFVNPLGINLSKFIYKERTTNKIFRFLHISNMSPIKGLHYIIEAFNELNKANKNIELWLVGAYPKEIVLQRMIKSNKNIKYFQSVAENKLIHFYHQCNVFVHPSLSDGWGMTVMQAMSSGLPVIVSDMTGTSEIIIDGENGWVVPSRDSGKLYTTMARAIEKEELLLQMGKNAHNSVKSGYTWDDYGDRLISWLNKND